MGRGLVHSDLYVTSVKRTSLSRRNIKMFNREKIYQIGLRFEASIIGQKIQMNFKDELVETEKL